MLSIHWIDVKQDHIADNNQTNDKLLRISLPP